MLEVAIIGAGPYGLSIAAYFRQAGIPFRIFGRPMDSWRVHMTKGMFLKSDGFASNIYDPSGEFTLWQFCKEQGITYRDTENPVGLDTFSSYGLAFKDRIVPELEDKLVVDLARLQDGFRIQLKDGEVVTARRVVLAVGITHFEHVPSELTHLPPEYLTHSSRHHELESFNGRNVVVVGGGSSATDLAGLLHDAGATVQLVARQPKLRFHTAPSGKPRTLWQRIRHPKSGLGPGLRSYFFSNAPMVFHWLPERLRLEAVRRSLGPSGGWFSKAKLIGRVPIFLGHQLESAEIQQGKVRLQLRTLDGGKREILTDHIIAATGYKVDLRRLLFLSEEIRAKLKAVDCTPVLSSKFESSVPGLFFVGVSAANSFGPLMRFAFGAEFAARRLTRTLLKSLSRVPKAAPAASAMITKNEQTGAI